MFTAVMEVFKVIIMPIAVLIVGYLINKRQKKNEAEIAEVERKRLEDAQRRQEDHELTRQTIEEERKRTLATQAGVQALLRDRLLDKIRLHKSKGYISIYDRDNIDRMYSEYRNLGGNSTVTRLMEDINDLPIYDTEEIEQIQIDK